MLLFTYFIGLHQYFNSTHFCQSLSFCIVRFGLTLRVGALLMTVIIINILLHIYIYIWLYKSFFFLFFFLLEIWAHQSAVVLVHWFSFFFSSSSCFTNEQQKKVGSWCIMTSATHSGLVHDDCQTVYCSTHSNVFTTFKPNFIFLASCTVSVPRSFYMHSYCQLGQQEHYKKHMKVRFTEFLKQIPIFNVFQLM